MFHRLIIMLMIGMSLACQNNSNEKQIRRMIEHIRILSQQKQFKACLDYLASDYSDNYGNNQATVASTLHGFFDSYDQLRIVVGIPKMEITQQTAKAHLKIKVFGIRDKIEERLFGATLLAHDFYLYFQQKGMNWKIVGSEIIRKQSLY